MNATKQVSRERSIDERLRRPARTIAFLLVLVLTVIFSREGSAEVVQLNNPGGDATAISCAPSGNGTGHMVCLEYAGGQLIGLSWQAPPSAIGKIGSEPTGTLGQFTLQPAQPPATPVRAPGCAPVFDGGTISCLVVTENSSGFSLLGVSFYPPMSTTTKMTDTQAELPLVQTPIASGTANVGNPTCAFAGGLPPQNVFAICTVAVNQQLYAIAFAPRLQKTSSFTPLAGFNSVVSNPSCDSVQNNNVLAVCAVRQQGGLWGFSLQYDPNNNVVHVVNSALLSTQSFTGDPSCAALDNGVGNCAILSGNTLFGAYVNPQVNPKPLQSLGVSPDTGAWSGGLGCSQLSDFRFANRQNANLSTCAVVSSSGNVFEVTFNPQTGRTLGILGPFASGAAGSPSCFALAIDLDQLYCGALTTKGAALGVNMPVGLLSPSTASAPLSVLVSSP
jgi:hypothetical protein